MYKTYYLYSKRIVLFRLKENVFHQVVRVFAKNMFLHFIFSVTVKCVSESYAPLNFHRLVYGPSIDFVGFKKPQGFVYIATYILSVLCHYTVYSRNNYRIKKINQFCFILFQIKHNTHIHTHYIVSSLCMNSFK